ncbi:DUF1080 domain-containing protein [Micromonospora sp. STR1s_5]|nr:DUF1080 domain-containing protein [Micromonospora sp. STR1s_5]
MFWHCKPAADGGTNASLNPDNFNLYFTWNPVGGWEFGKSHPLYETLLPPPNDGQDTQWTDIDRMAPPNGTWWSFKFVIDGTGADVWIDDVYLTRYDQVDQTADGVPNFTRGHIAMYSEDSRVQFDDIKVEQGGVTIFEDDFEEYDNVALAEETDLGTKWHTLYLSGGEGTAGLTITETSGPRRRRSRSRLRVRSRHPTSRRRLKSLPRRRRTCRARPSPGTSTPMTSTHRAGMAPGASSSTVLGTSTTTAASTTCRGRTSGFRTRSFSAPQTRGWPTASLRSTRAPRFRSPSSRLQRVPRLRAVVLTAIFGSS